MGAVGCVGVGARMRRADSVRCRARAGARAGVTSSSSAHAVRGKREARVVTSQASRRESVRVAAAMTVSPLSGGVSALRGAATVARPARGFGLQIFCKKTKSILKRQRQNERDRLLNKARKTRMKTTTKKATEALEACALNDAVDNEGHDEFATAEKLLGRAISAIDQARCRNVIHKNTASRRKERLVKLKKKVQLSKGWYAPKEEATAN